VAEPFKGVTADGRVIPGLFAIEKTGVSTRPLLDAARAFAASLSADQRGRTLFPVDGNAWQRWSNIHSFLMRHGVSLDEMAGPQRALALALLRESLSAGGFRTARDVMKLNELVLELTGSREEYGEWLYWLSLMGTPADDGPWGWQLDGHHLIVNCFVLGDQVVMTPLFMRSRWRRPTAPACSRPRRRAGSRSCAALTGAQREKAIIGAALPQEVFTAAFRDRLELRYEGVRAGELSTTQEDLLRSLLHTYVGRVRPGHAEVKMAEVARHLADTHFAWMGGFGDDSLFYYRVHSPVILIELDHQRGIALDNDEPSRQHIHTAVRTPNGNDYRRDLLRQHHAQFDHSRATHRH
jgi:Protein of unknown function (DUF3500)